MSTNQQHFDGNWVIQFNGSVSEACQLLSIQLSVKEFCNTKSNHLFESLCNFDSINSILCYLKVDKINDVSTNILDDVFEINNKWTK